MSEQALRLGTRRSKLAMAQSGQVAEAVSQVTGRPVELVEITTYGDTSREHLAQIGGTGVFVTALRDALLARGGRLRRALPQGSADRAARRAGAGRRTAARGPA